MSSIGVTCGACRGSGYTTAGACEACKGSGYVFFPDNGMTGTLNLNIKTIGYWVDDYEWVGGNR